MFVYIIYYVVHNIINLGAQVASFVNVDLFHALSFKESLYVAICLHVSSVGEGLHAWVRGGCSGGGAACMGKGWVQWGRGCMHG